MQKNEGPVHPAEIGLFVFVAALFGMVIWCVVQSHHYKKIRTKTYQAAMKCLVEEQDQVVDVMGHETECRFYRGKLENFAIAENEIVSQKVRASL